MTRILSCVLGLLLGNHLLAQEVSEDIGVKVPEGFQVQIYADDDLAHNVYSMTVDSLGRVVVAGPGYVKILIDADGDGKAESSKTFSDGPATGSMGMYFHGRDLFCTGDGGLLRFSDKNGDDRADGPPDVFLKIKTGGEHDAHAVRRGPDGWWYIIAGNTSDVRAGYATLPTSPVKLPEHGVLLRLKPDLSGGEIVAHGMRNAYDFDFNEAGQLYTFDSDDERDVSLPWYRPTRVFHLLPASHTGWLARSWKRPDDYFDMPPVLASFGRGSPTGVTCYRHDQFPAEYQNALFVQDWTFGRIWALPMTREGEIWSTKPIEFMTATGEHGFAPTDMEVGPDGSLYVCIGGRGTRGAVFRITHPARPTKAPTKIAKDAPLDEKIDFVLSARQPLASWSRQLWAPVALELGDAPFRTAARNEDLQDSKRVRAVEIITDLFKGLTAEDAATLAKSASINVRARTAWSIERVSPSGLDPELLPKLAQDADPLVRRTALETMALHPELSENTTAAIAKGLADPGKYVRTASIRAAVSLSDLHPLAEEVRRGSWRLALSFAIARHQVELNKGRKGIDAYAVELGRKILDGKHSIELKRDAARLIAIGLGDLGTETLPPAFFSYVSPLEIGRYERELDPLRISIAKLFPSGDPPLDEELIRLAALTSVNNQELLDKILDQISEESDPVDDIHRLLSIGRLPVDRTSKQQQRIASAVLAIDAKFSERKYQQDTNWTDRITEMYEMLVESDPELPGVLVRHPSFGRPGHILFLSRTDSSEVTHVADVFLKASDQPDFRWTSDVVFLLGTDQREPTRAKIRGQWDQLALRGPIVIALGQNPEKIDRERFVEGLDSSQLDVLSASLSALTKLGGTNDPRENVQLVRAARRLGTDRAEMPIRDQVVKLLERNTGKKIPFIHGEAGYQSQPEAIEAWTKWALETHAEIAQEMLGGDQAELEALDKLLKQVDWDEGEAPQGKLLFDKLGCATCHGGRSALGPDLQGIAGRFSRNDLFLAIAVPNRDVSPRYQTTMYETEGGNNHSGIIIYESVDGVILRDGSNRTIRLESNEIIGKRKLTTSLMPTGLLKDQKPNDLADLYAYLKSLKPGG